MLAVAVNLTLNLILIWPLAEVGLAVSTAVAAMLQVAVLAPAFSGLHCRLDWNRLWGTTSRTLVSTAAMSLAVQVALEIVPKSAHAGNAMIRVALPLFAGIAAYLAAYWLARGPELRMLIGRQPEPSSVS